MKAVIPTELKQAVCNDQLIVFVGAGVSYQFLNKKGQPLKGWGNLVDQILHSLKLKGYDVDMLVPLTKKYDPIKVLDLIECDKSIPKREVYEFVKEFLELDDEKNDYELHRRLHRLSSKIVTTNYDTAFERAIPELRKFRAYKGRNYELTTHRDRNSTLLFKLHGCFEDADSMVLFPSNYRNLYNKPDRDAEHSLLVLRNIVYNNSILFIGTGMGDFQINNLFQEIKKIQGEYNQRHFILMTNGNLDSSLNFLTPLHVKDYSEIGEIIEALIFLKEHCDSKESAEISILKKQLLEASKRIEELETGLIGTNDKLLEKKALQCYANGIALHLSNEPEKAIIEYKVALELKPDLYGALHNWGTYLGNLAKSKEGRESDELYRRAFEKFEEVIEIEPNNCETLFNWGTYLGEQAKTKRGLESEKLYLNAFTKFRMAVEMRPDEHAVWFNWATDLGNLARTKEGEESDRLYREAFDKFERVVKIKADFPEAFNNWGVDLGSLAKSKSERESKELYEEAFEKFKYAIVLRPDYHEAFNNWGRFLREQASTKSGIESDTLYRESFEKFRRSIEIKPDKHEALSNWGSALRAMAKTKEGEESEQLYREAFEKLTKAIEFGGNHYNLACLYGIRGLRKEAIYFLEVSLENGRISVDFVLNDEDWKDYLHDGEFKAVIDKHRAKIPPGN